MNFVTRSQWGARAPRRSGSIGTVRGIAVHWNGTKTNITSHSQCPSRVRSTQNFHMNTRGWADIAYNWVVCPHGTIYQGRGWGIRSAANGTNAGNAHYHAVSYLAGQGEPFTPEGKKAVAAVVAESHRRYTGKEVRPHSFFRSTACPGNEIRAWLSAGMPIDEGSRPPAPAPANTISRDSRGPAVKRWQERLRQWNSSALPRFGADGHFGDETADWTGRFMVAAKLVSSKPNNPVVGPRTQAAMEEVLKRPAFEFRYKIQLQKGSRGPSVREWQEALIRWNPAALPRFKADSDFGNETADWTGRFMVAAKLVSSKPDNPVVGPRTRAAMEKRLNS